MQGIVTHSFVESGWTFDYMINRVRNAGRVVVLMPSAQAPRNRRRPYYTRWAWRDDFGCHVIAVSDPTLQLHPSMVGGWFQGVHVDHVLPRVLRHIGQFLDELGLGWADCCFMGSSLGGFASLQAICHQPEARAFVEIAQTDLRLYRDPSMPVLARYCYGEVGVDAIPAEYAARLSVIETLRETGRIGGFHYVQQLADGHHLRQHYMPFVEYVTANAAKVLAGPMTLELLQTEREGPAHQALARPDAVRRVRALLQETF